MKITIEVENVDNIAAQVLVADAIAITKKAFETPMHTHTIGRTELARRMKIEVEL